MTGVSAITGLIPVTVASGVALRIADRAIPAKRKRQRVTKPRAKKRPSRRQVKRVTTSRSRSRDQLNKWIG